MNDGKVRAAVERGAGLLDEAIPGWEDRVNVDALEMKNMATCVLGQLGNGWAENGICLIFGLDPSGWRKRGLLDDGWDDPYLIVEVPIERRQLLAWTIEHGFDLDREMVVEDRAWGVLTSLWREQVRERLDVREPRGELLAATMGTRNRNRNQGRLS